MVPAGVALVLTQLLRSHESSADALRGSVAGVAAMVPEGLVLLTSVAFAVGALRLAQRRVLVQELAAVEGLARVDVLCIDKTGTLTSAGTHLDVDRPARVDRDARVEEVLEALFAADPAPNATLGHCSWWSSEPRLGGSTTEFPSPPTGNGARSTFAGHGTWVLGAPDVLVDNNEARGSAPTSVGSLDPAGPPARRQRSRSSRPSSPQLVPVAALGLTEEVRPDAAETVAYLLAQDIYGQGALW